MKKLVSVLILLTIILSGCQTGNGPEPATSVPASSQPAGSWEVGGNLTYSDESIWGDTLAGLETTISDNLSGDKQEPVQRIIIYDLKTRRQQRVIGLPAERMAEPPSIYGSKLVFTSVDRQEFFRYAISPTIKPEPNYDVFMFDLETGQMRQLTTDGHAHKSPRIYGDTVVWLTGNNQPLNQYPPPFDVYSLNLKTNKETRITANTTVEGYSQLAISGSRVVWTDMRHADTNVTSHPSNAINYNNEIYLYDLATNQERRITTSPANDWSPDIDGNRVIWIRQENYRKADVFMYDLDSGKETQISHSGYVPSSPSIYGDRIVRTDASSSQGNTDNDVISNGQLPGSTIILFDLKTQKETQLTPVEAGKLWLYPVIHENHVVFIWSRMIGSIVYALELTK